MDQPYIDTDCKPLEWWKINIFSCNGKASKKYLSIPATNVRSGRVFSSGGYIVIPCKISLAVKKKHSQIILERRMHGMANNKQVLINISSYYMM